MENCRCFSGVRCRPPIDGQIYSDPRNWAAGRLCDEARGESLSNDAWGGLGHAARDPLAALVAPAPQSPTPLHRFVRRAGMRYDSGALPVLQGCRPATELQANSHRCVWVRVLGAACATRVLLPPLTWPYARSPGRQVTIFCSAVAY